MNSEVGAMIMVRVKLEQCRRPLVRTEFDHPGRRWWAVCVSNGEVEMKDNPSRRTTGRMTCRLRSGHIGEVDIQALRLFQKPSNS